MKVHLTTAIVAVVALAGCTTTPADYATTLSQQDPKWDSPDCKQIRLAALGYDDKVGERMAIGVASGLLLGPFGLPLAASADANQEKQRKLFAREMHMRCSSLPLPKELHLNPSSQDGGKKANYP
ncbi:MULTISPECIES: hypothetical protein [unclassified Mesorhizobium]|uniref:hypothetical protein n=1 Tax=unclassified Mesorhizobium TaxID=325217 RepID=UPI00333B7454